MAKAQIRIRCGIGDFITYLTRIQTFKEVYPIDELHIYVAGGWKNVPKQIIEIAQPCIASGLINSISEEEVTAELKEDWQPDNNPLKYKMKIPFEVPTFHQDAWCLNIDQPIAVIQPITTQGSFEGFNEGRNLPREDWLAICDKIKQLGYFIVQIGDVSERDYLPKNEFVDMNACGLNTLRESIDLLKLCDLCVATNSWPWEVAAYAGKKTLCLYYTNFEIWCKIHVPKFAPPDYGMTNLRIEEKKNLGQIMAYIEELHNA